ncbi:hypothetical protein L6452_14095 [Arctium lappa]|uniref:Uncharacterized protein n=1 Tax=Arctium lappa TaxID=4217 RepID=A0ACB9CKG6_ARCLA|nr:hypothetical protein L6452_14095 [Arctium lappa]
MKRTKDKEKATTSRGNTPVFQQKVNHIYKSAINKSEEVLKEETLKTVPEDLQDILETLKELKSKGTSKKELEEMLKAIFKNEDAPSNSPLMIQESSSSAGGEASAGGEDDIMQDAQDRESDDDLLDE